MGMKMVLTSDPDRQERLREIADHLDLNSATLAYSYRWRIAFHLLQGSVDEAIVWDDNFIPGHPNVKHNRAVFERVWAEIAKINGS